MTDENMDVPAFLRSLPVCAVFTPARPDEQPDSWIKIGEDTYRRTYFWFTFKADDFREWRHAELTEPVGYSISQGEADEMEARQRSRPGPREMGQ
jgi:hypothetical protein